MGRPLKWRMLRSFDDFFRRQIELEQAQHLRVAVLLDDVDALVRGDEVVHFAGERIGAQAQVICVEVVFLLELVAALAMAKSEVPKAMMPIFDLPVCTTSGRGTRVRAVSNLLPAAPCC